MENFGTIPKLWKKLWHYTKHYETLIYYGKNYGTMGKKYGTIPKIIKL